MIPEPVILSFYDFIRENVVKYSKNETGRYGEMKNLEKVIPIFWFAVIAVSGCGKETVVQKVETNTNILWQSDTADVDGDGMADQVVVEGLLDNGAYDTLLTVTLDSGATGSMRFKGRTEAKQDFITVATGDIFSDGKDAVVIEITNSSSNYGSSDIHVLSMEQVNGKLYITERLSILDGMENSTVYSLYKESFFPLGEPIVSMTSEEELITPLPEQEINAIKVNGYGEEAGSGTYVYWNGDEWVASDNVFFYEEDIPLEESFELGNYYVTNRVTSDGKLYGMGASLSGLLGEENGSDIYDSIEAYEKISTPTLLMENVAYARAGREAIVALEMDGSVWWWGQYRAVSSTQSYANQSELYWKNEEDASNLVKMLYNSPVKILDHCIYATTGNNTGAAITEKGELYTWGFNIFGECGVEVSERDDYVREPQKVLDQVKMVWPEQIGINSAEKEIPEIARQDSTYPYNLFVELENGAITACGEGLGNQTKTIAVTNDMVEETSYCYSEEFVPVILRQYSEEYNREILNQCSFGMTEQEVADLLEAGGLNYFYSSVEDNEDSPSYMVVEDSRYFLYFDDKGELYQVLMQAGGSRSKEFTMGMSLEEVKEKVGGDLQIEEGENRIYWSENPVNGTYYGFVFTDQKVSVIWEEKERG